jgi:hypothetical protein
LPIFATKELDMEAETNNQEGVRIERRKGITFNLEIQKKSNGYPVFLRITENGQHRRYKSTIVLKRKSDWDVIVVGICTLAGGVLRKVHRLPLRRPLLLSKDWL